VVLGIWLALFLPETPMTSKWLTDEDKMLFQQDVSAFPTYQVIHIIGEAKETAWVHHASCCVWLVRMQHT
jgi:hypothetical protein